MQTEVTALLELARTGDRSAFDRLFDLVYEELHGLARAQLVLRGRPSATLDTTALVHEVYLKLVGKETVFAKDRGHFFSLAARVMRHLVVDEYRRRDAVKHGGHLDAVALEYVQLPSRDASLDADVLALDHALGDLEKENPDLARLVELRFFVGLALPEIAEILDRSERSLKRDWRKARAFLMARLEPGSGDEPEPTD